MHPNNEVAETTLVVNWQAKEPLNFIEHWTI